MPSKHLVQSQAIYDAKPADFDFTLLRATCGEDLELEQELVVAFLREATSWCNGLSLDLKNERFSDQLVRIRGAAQLVGATELAEAIDAAYKKFRAGKLSRKDASVAISERLAATASALHQALPRLQNELGWKVEGIL